jgi:lipopolysaccharide export system permease protein
MQVSQVFAAVGNMSPMLAVWIPNIIYGLLGIFMVKIAPK